MTAKRLRILHISDVHFGKTERSGTNWRMRRVLGGAWAQNLREIMADGPLDIVCFTGDLAQSGKAHEYEQVSAFCDELLRIVKLDRSRLLVVPGNHDVDRDLNKAEWKSARKIIPRVPPADLAEWMAGGEPPLGVKAAWRDALLARQTDFRAWLLAYGLSHCLPGRDGQRHPHLGYRFTLDGWPQPVHFVGLDSAWLAGDNNDAEKLRITDAQVGRHFTTADGNGLGGVAIALVHHPVSTVADGTDIRGLLNLYNVPLLLHGHLHDPALARWQPRDGRQPATDECAAGCLYEHDKYPNGFQVIDLAIADASAVAVSQVWARSWTPKGKGRWFNDNSALDDAVDGRWRPHAPTVYRSVHTYYEISDVEGHHATTKNTQIVRANQPGVRSFITRGISGSGRTVNVRSNLGSTRVVTEGGVLTAHTTTYKPLPMDRDVKHVLSYDGIDCYLDRTETVAQNISRHLEHSGIHVTLPVERPLKSVSGFVILPNREEETVPIQVSDDKRLVSLVVTQPTIGSRLLLRWTW